MNDPSEISSFAVFHEDVEHVVGLVDESLVIADDIVIRAKLFEDISAEGVMSYRLHGAVKEYVHFFGELFEISFVHSAVVEFLSRENLQ